MAPPLTRAAAADACSAALDTEFFRALCEPVRVEIFRQLILQGRCDVGTIAAAMPQDRSVVARHLQLMERAGLLQAQTEGRHTFYEIDGPAVATRLRRMTELVERLAPLCCPGRAR